MERRGFGLGAFASIWLLAPLAAHPNFPFFLSPAWPRAARSNARFGPRREFSRAAREFFMANKMIIDASHPEETRVVVLRGNRVEEFDFESASKKPLRGNIYLAKVTRVEPSLQAAFIDYGGNRHGFLAFSEIHPDYYQIPVADRQALLEEEALLASRGGRGAERRTAQPPPPPPAPARGRSARGDGENGSPSRRSRGEMSAGGRGCLQTYRRAPKHRAACRRRRRRARRGRRLGRDERRHDASPTTGREPRRSRSMTRARAARGRADAIPPHPEPRRGDRRLSR